MGEAFALTERIRVPEQQRLLSYRQQLWDGIHHLPGIHQNGSTTQRIAGLLNLSFSGIDGEALITALSEIAISSTSACSSASIEPSYVLRALGLSPELAKSSIRLSMGRFTSEEDIKEAIDIISRQIAILTRKNESL